MLAWCFSRTSFDLSRNWRKKDQRKNDGMRGERHHDRGVIMHVNCLHMDAAEARGIQKAITVTTELIF